MASVNGIPSDGPWFLAEGEDTMIRARQDLLPRALSAGLEQRVVVTWRCRNPLGNGLPSEDDYREIKEAEALMVSFLEEGAILAFVVTRDGGVNMNFYTSDTDWFLERFNEALDDKPPLPIELSGEHDPDWEEYRAVLRSCGVGEAD